MCLNLLWESKSETGPVTVTWKSEFSSWENVFLKSIVFSSLWKMLFVVLLPTECVGGASQTPPARPAVQQEDGFACSSSEILKEQSPAQISNLG